MRSRTRTALAVLALGFIGAGSPALAVAQEIDTPAIATAAPEIDTPATPEVKTPGIDTSATSEIDAPAVDTSAAPEAEAPATATSATPDEAASDTAMRVITWVIASGDNRGLPFIVVDKVAAAVFVFNAEGGFLGATPALLGSASGDDSAPGIGERELSAIAPGERTTPAGRFLAAFGYANGERKVLWVDYDTAISLHAVVYANKKEQRLNRLYSPAPDDNRITYGCINIAAAFYENLVRPLFTDTSGVVYILPDTKSLEEVFPALPALAAPDVVQDLAQSPDPPEGEPEAGPSPS